MAIQTRREAQGRITDLWNRPLEWAHGLSLRILGWFNQERWASTLTITALVLANLIILYFFITGQDNRAVGFTVVALIMPLVLFIPELGIAVFIIAGSNLIVNAMYYAAGMGSGTGQRTLVLGFFMLIWARAVYEYIRLPREERPRVFTWFTVALMIFWLYYMGHVLYIYTLGRYDLRLTPERAVGYADWGTGIIRYFDPIMLWIGALPLIVLMRDRERTKRALTIVGAVVFIAAAVLLIEFISPLPEFWKVVFQIKRAGETQEGYRIAAPDSMFLIVLGFLYALFRIGYTRGALANTVLVTFLALAAFAILTIKTRILWAPLLVVAPLALLWKPPQILVNQAKLLFVVGLFGAALMLSPQISAPVIKLLRETEERWSRNYAFGGDPRNDPSYQGRIREHEQLERAMATMTPFQQLFGRGLEATYGRYLPVTIKLQLPYRNVYYEHTGSHFSWYWRLYSIGWVGTILLAILMGAAILRGIQVFFATRDENRKALVFAVTAATVVLLPFDSISFNTFNTYYVLPLVLLWSLIEVVDYWNRQDRARASQTG